LPLLLVLELLSLEGQDRRVWRELKPSPRWLPFEDSMEQAYVTMQIAKIAPVRSVEEIAKEEN
jgi:hypothetical protein